MKISFQIKIETPLLYTDQNLSLLVQKLQNYFLKVPVFELELN